jgi:hypothetical protein
MHIIAIIFIYCVARAVWHLLAYLPQIAVLLLILYVIGAFAS